MPINTTHQNINLGLGGGFDYEFLLGAEIAFVSLLPEFKTDWSCDEEEVPIFSHIRKWTGPIVELTGDQPSGKGKPPIGEDVNLLGADGSRLHIQIKSGPVSMDDLKKVIRRFLKVYEFYSRKSQFLLVNGGLPKGFAGCQTLADLPQGSPSAKTLATLAAAKLTDDISVRSFLGRVHLTRAPLYERISASLHGLVARLSKLNRSKPPERKHISLLVDAYRTRFSKWAMRRDNPLTAERVKNFLESPPNFRELAEKYSLNIDFVDTDLLAKLEEILGWGLQDLGMENIFLLLSAVSNKPPELLSGLQSTKIEQLRLASSASSWDERGLGSSGMEPSFIVILRLVRLASVLSGQLVTPEIQQMAFEGHELARLLCLFSRGNEVTLVDSHLTAEISDLGRINQLYKKPCRDLLTRLCEQIPSIHAVSIEQTLVFSDPIPDWMEQDPSPLTSESPARDGDQLPSGKRKGLERLIAAGLSEMRSLAEVDGTESKMMALQALESLAQQCRNERLDLLLVSINEVRGSILEKLHKRAEAVQLLLESVEVILMSGRSHSSIPGDLRKIGRLAHFLSAEDQLRYDILRARNAAIRSDFGTLQSVCRERDPQISIPWSFPQDQGSFRVRIAEVRAIFMHGTIDEAVVATEQMLTRIANAPAEVLIEVHLLALQIARAAELKGVARKFQAAFMRASEAIHQDNLKPKLQNSLVQARALYAHLQFLFADDGEELNDAFQDWLRLDESIEDDEIWATYLFDRLHIGTQRGLIEWKQDAKRLAAASIKRKNQRVAWEQLQTAGAYLAAGNHRSALESVYLALDAALHENCWSSWTEARRMLAILWLADDLNIQAANAYINDGTLNSEKSFLKELSQKLTEGEASEIVDLVIVPVLSDTRRTRGWELLVSLADKIDVRSRVKILEFAEREVALSADTKVQTSARRQLAKLVGAFFKCPSNEEAPRELSILLGFVKSEPLEIGREALQSIRRAFWSATGPTLALHQLEALLGELDRILSENSGLENEKRCAVDIASSLLQNNPKVQNLVEKALAFIKKYGRLRDSESALTFTTPSVAEEAVSKALAATLTILERRIERLPDGSVRTSLFGDNINEIRPFLPHCSPEQISKLYEVMLETASDSEADAHLRGQVFEFLKNPHFQGLPTAQLTKSIELLYQRLEGRQSENMFDRNHRHANNSIYSGLQVSADLPLRIQRDALIALAAFQKNPSVRDIERYAELLAQLAFSAVVSTRVSVGTSIKVYFECCDISDPLLSPILVRLISDSDDEVASSGIIAAAEELEATGNLEPLAFRLLDAVYRSKPELQRRIALAIFCRPTVTSNYRGPHRAEILRWHRALSEDRNPIVRKYADTAFWKVQSGRQ
ncbi:hypothetical protein JST97_35540 [bacterium]|nr:hypothetical protein [bacterium]